MLAILTVVMLTGVTVTTVQMMSGEWWSDGECLAGWASINCLGFLYNAKDTNSFYSGHWNTGTNPDLAFTSIGPNSRLLDRLVLDKCPKSQHCPLLITPPRFAIAVPSMPVKRWNFCKAKWSHYIALMNKFAKTLLPPNLLDVDVAFQDFCNIIKKAAKKTISHRYQNNYILCWDAECESLYKTFLQSSQGDHSSLAATALLAQLDRKRRDRWSKAVWSNDLSHSSQKAWSILVGHDTLLVTVSFQPMLLNLSWLEMGNTRLLTASHLDLSLKKCLTFGGPQHQTQ